MFSGLGMDDLSSEFLFGSLPMQMGQTQQSLEQAVEASSTLDLPNAVDIPPSELVPSLGDKSRSPSFREVAFDPMIQLYYQNFHGSHPFAIPWKAVNSPLCQYLPSYLLSVMRYIGSHYHPNLSFRDIYQRKAYSELSNDISRTGFKVQGLLLISIVDHASGYEDKALQTLDTAIKMALDIQMNRESFVRDNSGGNAILEESWHRTYWELYVVSGLFAAFRQQTTFALHSQYADIRLPCSDEIYNRAGLIPRGRTLEEFQNYWLHDDPSNNFSSFSYRIQTTQILGTILSLGHHMDSSDGIQAEAIDARLASLAMHQPAAQREIYRSNGTLDEMALQAQMINYLSLICLHYPRSNMRFVPFRNPSSCVRQRTIEDSNSTLPNLDLHSVKALRAADMLASLAALPSPIKRQSPFMTCGLAITVTVHLAAALTQAGGTRLDTLKARIDLALGGLNMLGEVWPLAQAIRKQLVGLYSEMIAKH
ncbi:transcriptional regulator family: Fungal Specific TF [Paecilomyces variotii]|nr:transcriptional regulator family: Fungal Specific TF [Paecilomyces variotii]